MNQLQRIEVDEMPKGLTVIVDGMIIVGTKEEEI